MKMYIAVLDEVGDFMVPTLVAHAVLSYHLVCTDVYEDCDGPRPTQYERLYEQWLVNSFKKCVVRVNQKEFDKISALPDVGLFYENKTLNGEKSCAVLVVNEEIPNVLKFAKLWEPAK